MRKVAGCLSMILLAGMLLPLNLLQMLSLLLVPLSPRLFRAANRGVCAIFFGSLGKLLEGPCGVEILVTGDRLPATENAFVISNHQSGVDIPVIVALAARLGRQGDVKWFVKDPIKYVPGIGWGMLFLDCIFLKRNWMADRQKVMGTFQNLREHRSPFWLVSFLEGTRITPAKRERSQVYARKQGLPHFNHVMVPRTKGFEATIEGLGDHKQAVYDLTIGYENKIPTVKELFLGPVKRIHVFARRYGNDEIPASPEGRARWVLERFQEKERRLEAFSREGRFAP